MERGGREGMERGGRTDGERREGWGERERRLDKYQGRQGQGRLDYCSAVCECVCVCV